MTATMALASLYKQDPISVEKCFQHLTRDSLDKLKADISGFVDPYSESSAPPCSQETTTYRVLARAALRRASHKQLDKFASIASSEEVKAALQYHTLPLSMQTELWNKYGGSSAPTTWWEALERLREIAGNDTSRLWRMVLDHPMTAYVPMQCQSCGHVIPDVASDESDNDLGLSEVETNTDDGNVLEIRGGWFRGRPRGPVILQLACPKCQSVTKWYRSGHPKIILNPNRWGRLCGEQEDLRLALAKYLGVQVRTCVPLDWDHIWSEFTSDEQGFDPSWKWWVQDDSARNFAVRLNEGIGAWTGILGIHPNPDLCKDLTFEYLTVRDSIETGEDVTTIGRADPCHAKEMHRYRDAVISAREDSSGSMTQAKTVLGYLLQRAGMTSDVITEELKRAALEYGSSNWYNV